MRYTKERKKEHLERVRRVLVMNPNASILEIRKSLTKLRKPLKLDKEYINKLVNKIRKERAERINHYTVNTILARFTDKMTESDLMLWKIIRSPESTQGERVQALREIRNNDKELFNMMLDAGVFERKLGELSVKDKNIIKDLDKLSKDDQRKYFAKIAEARAIRRSRESDSDRKD